MSTFDRPSSTSRNSLRCDSATSDEYLELSTSPEPLRLLNRYRELCRIFRVRHANSFIVKLLLKFSWAEIQSQLAIIRNNKIVQAKQQQFKEYKLQLQIEFQEKEKQERMIREQQRKGIINQSHGTTTNQPSSVTTATTSVGMKKSVRIAEEGNVTTFFDESSNSLQHQVSSAQQHQQQQNNQHQNRNHASTEELILIIQELEEELSQSQAMLTYQPYLWRESFQILDCSRTYLGPRGIIAVAALVSEMPWILEFNLSNMAWYNCDERSSEFCPTGEEVLRVVCLLLSNHPSLEVLTLDGNDFATTSYVWLVDFCKKHATQMKLKKISLEDTLLEDFQKQHLQGVLNRNENRREKYALAELERLADPQGRNFYASTTTSSTTKTAAAITSSPSRLNVEGKVGFAESFAASIRPSIDHDPNTIMAQQQIVNAKDKMLQSHRKEKLEKSQNLEVAATALTTARTTNAKNDGPAEKNTTNANTVSSLDQTDNRFAPPPKISHLPSGPTSHRRGWNHLLQFCTHHPEHVRWSVLVMRELCQTVFTSSDSASKNSQQIVPVSPSREKQRKELQHLQQQQKLKLMQLQQLNTNNNMMIDKSPLSHSPSKLSPRITNSNNINKNGGKNLNNQQQSQYVPLNTASSQSMIYLMSGGGPNILPGLRDSLIQHPFTTENCRFQTTPEIHQILETVFKCNPVLSLLDDAAKNDVISRGRIIKRTSRSVIMEAGDPCDFVYLILHGGLEIRGRPQVLAAAAFAEASSSKFASSSGSINTSNLNNGMEAAASQTLMMMSNSMSMNQSTKASFLASSSLNNNNNNNIDGSITGVSVDQQQQQRQGVANSMLTYFASPSIFPPGAFVGGEELIQPNITQNERRTATLIATPCSVLPPVLCRRALVRQTISMDNDKAEQFMSNLPIVEACYENSALLERANAELEYATNTPNATKNNNNSNNNVTINSGALSRSFNSHMSMIASNGEDIANGLRQHSSSKNQMMFRSSSPADPHRGEKNVTIDDDEEGLELEADNHNSLRMERLKQLYGIQSPQELRETEKRAHQNRLLSNSADDEKESAVRRIEERLLTQSNTNNTLTTNDETTIEHSSDFVTPTKSSSSSASNTKSKSTSGFKSDHDSVTVLFLVPRDVLVHKLLASIRDHRKMWGPFLESLPSLVSLPTHYKMLLADCMRRRQFTQGEIVGAGLNLYDSLFVILEGNATVYFQRSEIRRLGRGDIFACHPKTDVSRVSVVASSSVSASTALTSVSAYLTSSAAQQTSQFGGKKQNALSQLVIGIVAPTFAATLPIGLQRFLLKMRRVYSLAADPKIVQPDGS